MAVDADSPTADAVIEVVIGLLEDEGYDAVQVREVAKRARISLATLYKLFDNRDELIVAALMRWMDRAVYARMVEPDPEASVYDGLLGLYRQLFEPCERRPLMLEAYHRARSTPAGRALDDQGVKALAPRARQILDRTDPEYGGDVAIILNHVFEALVGRFARGEVAIKEILDVLERTLFRLTADNRTLLRRATDPTATRK